MNLLQFFIICIILKAKQNSSNLWHHETIRRNGKCDWFRGKKTWFGNASKILIMIYLWYCNNLMKKNWIIYLNKTIDFLRAFFFLITPSSYNSYCCLVQLIMQLPFCIGHGPWTGNSYVVPHRQRQKHQRRRGTCARALSFAWAQNSLFLLIYDIEISVVTNLLWDFPELFQKKPTKLKS